MRSLQDQISTLIRLADYYKQDLLLKDLSPVTIAKYRQQLTSFCDWLGEREPSIDLAKLFFSELRQKGYKTATIRSYYAALSPYFAYLHMPLKLKLKKEKHLPRYHTQDEFNRLIQAIADRQDNWAKNKERDILIVKTLAFTGLRRSELLSLRCEDIKGNFVFVSRGKGGRDRVIPLIASLRAELSAYIDRNHLAPGDRCFPIGPNRLARMIREAAAKAGLKHITPHGLRHYFATMLVARGAQLRAVQELMGHEDISTTAIYLDVIPAHLTSTIKLLEEET